MAGRFPVPHFTYCRIPFTEIADDVQMLEDQNESSDGSWCPGWTAGRFCSACATRRITIIIMVRQGVGDRRHATLAAAVVSVPLLLLKKAAGPTTTNLVLSLVVVLPSPTSSVRLSPVDQDCWHEAGTCRRPRHQQVTGRRRPRRRSSTAAPRRQRRILFLCGSANRFSSYFFDRCRSIGGTRSSSGRNPHKERW